ncbi:MAG: gluconate 2-dehydrogenase subunit 3 family protein [Verrucomicrobiaceae bacterium]
MHTPAPLPRISRRVSLQWMLGATAALATRERQLFAADPVITAKGYGPDPSMVKIYAPGDVWPLTLTEPHRRTTHALCDLILPADDTSPSACAVGVPDFIDEWISSPYPAQAGDRRTILDGLKWIDEESKRRFNKLFADLTLEQQTAICDAIASLKPKPELKRAATFFKRFRDLAAGGYYTTPEGAKAMGYTGNMPSGTFEGPPVEALKHVGLL